MRQNFLTSKQIRTYNPTNAMSSLTTTPISQASATQRAGRAGRTAPGVCYRLYTQRAYEAHAQTTLAERVTTNNISLHVVEDLSDYIAKYSASTLSIDVRAFYDENGELRNGDIAKDIANGVVDVAEDPEVEAFIHPRKLRKLQRVGEC